MTHNDLMESLELLKTDLASRTNNRAITTIISRYVAIINACIEYGLTRTDIYEAIFNESDRNIIKYDYFINTILYRARLKAKKNTNSKQSINPIQPQKKIRSVINEPAKKPNTENMIIKQQRQNPLANLEQSKDENELHDSSSDLESLQARMARMLEKKENQND